jgi:hypothetical protein
MIFRNFSIQTAFYSEHIEWWGVHINRSKEHLVTFDQSVPARVISSPTQWLWSVSALITQITAQIGSSIL